MELRKTTGWLAMVAWLIMAPGWYAFAKEGVPAMAFRSLADALSPIKTPEALVQLMKKEFKYVEDERLLGQNDHWQSPEELWKRKAGDCEDFALFAQYVLKKQGFETQVVSLYGAGGYGHTVAVFKKNGKYHVVNEDRLSYYNASSLEEALTRVNPGWIWASIATRRGGRGWSLREIRNPFPAPVFSHSDPFSELPF